LTPGRSPYIIACVKVALINHHYAPELFSQRPNAWRWAAIAEHWAERGHHVDVVCASKPGLLHYNVINGVRVHRVGGKATEFKETLSSGQAIKSVSRGSKGFAAGSRSLAKMARSSLPLLGWVHQRTWKKVYWPDHACLWYFGAVRKARQLLAEGGYDGLISVSQPFTAHLVGYGVKKRYPEVPWVVDFGDPFSFTEDTPHNNFKLYRGLNHRVESGIFDAADVINLTIPGAAEKYAEVFPRHAAKMRVTPFPLPSVESEGTEQPMFPDDGKMRLVFTGNLYKSIRNPRFLLRLFAALLRTRLADRLELHFFGNLRDCEEYFEPYEKLLGKKIFIHGLVPRNRALQAIREADAVVNISNATPYQLPTKVLEYVSAGKPVLNLASIANDSSVRFFGSYPGALNLMVGAEPTTEQRDEVVRFLEEPPFAMDPSGFRGWFAPYLIDSVAAAYENALAPAKDGRVSPSR
jgi:glycosyltransferase involved in cell wall biosynthesis